MMSLKYEPASVPLHCEVVALKLNGGRPLEPMKGSADVHGGGADVYVVEMPGPDCSLAIAVNGSALRKAGPPRR